MVCAGLAAAAFGGIYWSLPETAGAAYRLQRAADQLAQQDKGGDVELATAGPGFGKGTASSVFVITSDEEEAEAEEGGDGDDGDGVGEEIKDAEGLSSAGNHCYTDAAHDDDHVSTTVAISTSSSSHNSNSTAHRLWQRLLGGPASSSSSAFARLPEESGHGAPAADGPESTPSSSSTSASSAGESTRSLSGPPTTVWGMLCDPQLGFIYGIYTAFSFAVRAHNSTISHSICSRRPC
jgi:hypothetical protein